MRRARRLKPASLCPGSPAADPSISSSPPCRAPELLAAPLPPAPASISPGDGGFCPRPLCVTKSHPRPPDRSGLLSSPETLGTLLPWVGHPTSFQFLLCILSPSDLIPRRAVERLSGSPSRGLGHPREPAPLQLKPPQAHPAHPRRSELVLPPGPVPVTLPATSIGPGARGSYAPSLLSIFSAPMVPSYVCLLIFLGQGGRCA